MQILENLNVLLSHFVIIMIQNLVNDGVLEEEKVEEAVEEDLVLIDRVTPLSHIVAIITILIAVLACILRIARKAILAVTVIIKVAKVPLDIAKLIFPLSALHWHLPFLPEVGRSGT